MNEALKLGHFKGLCVTAGQQPYMALQEVFRQEIVGGPTFLEPGFLDAPAFMPTGHTYEYDGFDKRSVLQAIVLIEER